MADHSMNNTTKLSNRSSTYFHPISESNTRSPFGELTQQQFYARHGVSHSTSSFINSNGLRIFTQKWTPSPEKPTIAALCVLHGFTGESSWMVQLTAVSFASVGFSVAALDLQGHGFSEGLPDHIPDIQPVLDDCSNYFSSFLVSESERHRPNVLPAFLYGESLGGAIVLLLHLQSRIQWRGLVLNGAMCGVSSRFKPPWPLEHLLSVAAALVPTWCVVPTRSIPDVSFKEEWKARLAKGSPRRRMRRPRAATALELMRVAGELQRRFEEVAAPLLILHGEEDVVCDPECVRELYRRCRSRDKTLKIYEGMWHQLIGEPKENVERVFGDMYSWLMERAGDHQLHSAATAGGGSNSGAGGPAMNGSS